MKKLRIIPKTGFKGLTENWQSDLLAAVSVSLVALPLGLGIAFASGVTPMAGIFSAIIGGLVTTFFRGSHIAINGPAAGLIAVILTSIAALDDGSGNVLGYLFAAIMVSGALQVLLGILKMGRFAELFHPTVVQGIMAAIGIIIFAKQIHLALGTTTEHKDILGTIMDAFLQIPNINPFVFVISLAGLLLLIFHSRISFKFFHFLPAPMWVLIISIPFVYLFNFFDAHQMEFLGKSFAVGPELLVDVPSKILDAIKGPNFSRIHTLPFWTSVISITMIASIQSLAMAKAIDKLDPYDRKTDTNKDLIGVGLSTMVSGAIGGLPIINVIVRSSVNVQNHAKTKWSNLYHGLILLLIVLVLAPVIQKIPLAALAILLVYTGYKLASPKLVKHVYDHGIEQLIIFAGTIGLTIYSDLLTGIFWRIIFGFIDSFLMAKLPIKDFFQQIFRANSTLENPSDNNYELKVHGIANFLSTLKMNKFLAQIPLGANVNIDFTHARLVDYSILEDLNDYKRVQKDNGGKVEFAGLENHISSSDHKLAMKLQTAKVLTSRQKRLQALAVLNDWEFKMDPDNLQEKIESFYFFRSRPIEECYNSIAAATENADWEVIDVCFDEGAFEFFEEQETTLGLINFNFPIPKFSIEEKDFMEKYLHLSEHKDIDYTVYHDFPKEFLVKVEDENRFRDFLCDDFKALVKSSKMIHHIESNGEALLLFTDNLRFAKVDDYDEFTKFTKQLKRCVLANHRKSLEK